jgi:predicted RNA polymerase sigma factor
MRTALCDEALRLGRMLAQLLPGELKQLEKASLSA